MIDGLVHVDAYAEGHPREVGCIRIAKQERGLMAAPLFAFGPIPDHLTNTLFYSLDAHAVGCYVVRDGLLGDDGVLFHGRTALWSLAFNHGEDYVAEILARGSPVPSRIVRRIGGTAVCIHGPGTNVYGHWLVDFLPRLHVLARAGYDITALTYILPYDCPRYGLAFLQLLGIPAEQLVPYDPARELVQADELLVPTNLRNGNRLHSVFAEASRAWVRTIVPDEGAAAPDRRLFVSRAGIGSDRVLSNRAVIEDMAQSAGFEIVHPERLGLAEQIALFRRARQMVGEYGSALHATIYGGRSLHCCAIRGTSHWLGFIQSGLAQALDQTMSYVFGEAEAEARVYEFEIYQENFRRALDCLEIELTRR